MVLLIFLPEKYFRVLRLDFLVLHVVHDLSNGSNLIVMYIPYYGYQNNNRKTRKLYIQNQNTDTWHFTLETELEPRVNLAKVSQVVLDLSFNGI